MVRRHPLPGGQSPAAADSAGNARPTAMLRDGDTGRELGWPSDAGILRRFLNV